jgi:hypothetical protein
LSTLRALVIASGIALAVFGLSVMYTAAQTPPLPPLNYRTVCVNNVPVIEKSWYVNSIRQFTIAVAPGGCTAVP